MTDSTTGRAKELFLDALELAPESRAEWLEGLRADAPELHARVVKLLAANESATDIGIDRVSEMSRSIHGHLKQAALALAVGERVGDYELLGQIGSGSGGVVYRARQVSLERIVAVKLLAGGRLAGERALRRFRAEAEAAARLEHQHIVPVYEVGEHEGRPFFSMRWIEGGNLAEHAERFRRPRDAARLLATIARAVHHGHQRGILHRDIKPSNILLDLQGAPHVADFGVAKRIDVEASATATGGLQGTPAYMAPEQVSSNAGELTTATDVWGLGCVLYEVLAARRAFAGESFTEVLLAVRERDPAPLRRIEPRVPRDLETICQRALAKEPARRYPSALAFAEDLERFLDHHPIRARRTRFPERLSLTWRRHPVTGSLVAAVALLVVALAVGASWASWSLNDSLEQTRAAQADARELLRTSLHEQARARRLNRDPGRSHDSLELLQRAAEIRPGPDLRDEAIACLALTDLVPERTWELPAGSHGGVCFDATFERMALARPDGTVVVEELASGAQRVLPGTGARPWCGIFSPDGRALFVHYAATDEDAAPELRVWDLESGAPRFSVRLHVDVRVCGFHPDSTRFYALLSGSDRVRELDLRGGAHRDLRLPAKGARDLAVRPDGRALAVAPCGELAACVLDLVDGEVTASLDLEGAAAWCLDWDRAGERLALGTEDRRALLWDVRRGELVATFSGHQAEVVSVGLSEREGVLVTGAWDGILRVFELESSELVLSAPSTAPGVFDRAGARLSYARGDEVGLFEISRGELFDVVRAHDEVGLHSLAVSPDGTVLASAADDGVVLWDLARDERLGRLSEADSKEVLFQSDGGRVLAATDEAFLSWSYGPGPMNPAEMVPEVLHAGSCNRAAISADGRVAAVDAWSSGAPEGVRVHVFWLDGSRPPLALSAFARADQLSLSRGGRWLAVGNWGGRRTRVWDLESGELAHEYTTDDSAHFPRFDPVDDRLLVSTRAGLLAFRTGSWEEELVLARSARRDHRVGLFALSPDGRTVAYGVEGSIVELREADSMELICTLSPPEVHPSTWITFGPDGRRLYIATSNRTTLVWDLSGLQRELQQRGLWWSPDER